MFTLNYIQTVVFVLHIIFHVALDNSPAWP